MINPQPTDFRLAWETTYRYVARHSPYYRDLFAGRTSVPHPHEVPTIDKTLLSQRNLDFLAAPREEIIEVVTTSGTTGDPLIWMLTARDLERLGHSEYLGFQSAGLTPADTVLVAVTLDRCFIAGLAYVLGLRKLGCATIRVGPSSPALVVDVIKRLAPTAIVGVPSFLRMVARKALETGIDLRNASVRRAICIGEPVRQSDWTLNAAGRAIELAWNARVYSTYGVTELASGCGECETQTGGHLPEGLLHFEILDEAGPLVPDGVVGEVVATTFEVEGMPLLRYRTGDCAAMFSDPCACGRTTPRLGPIVGRKQHKLKIKGTSVFPLALQSILDEAPGVSSYVIVATVESELSDAVEVIYHGEANAGDLCEAFRARAKMVPRIRLGSREEIEALQMPPQSRKRQSFVDRRGLS